MDYGIEYEVVFEYGGKVFLISTENKRERIDVSSLGLNKEAHNQCYIDEDNITFRTRTTSRGSRREVQSLTIDGEDYFHKSDVKKKAVPNKNSTKRKPRKISKAFAPYNFVPLNKLVSESKNNSDHSNFAKGLHSGYIDYEVDNLTDLFIREESVGFNFFGKSLKKVRIPGSSMRGLIRTLYEIITFSKIGETDLQRLFFNRKVGRDMSRYKERILGNQRAGWVKRKGRKYFLVEAQSLTGNKNFIKVAVASQASLKDKRFINKVKDRNDVFIEWDKLGIKERQYAWNEVYIRIERGAAKEIASSYKMGLEPCTLFQTGHIFSKKHQYIIGNRIEGAEEWDVTLSINLDISDVRRANDYDLFEKLRKQEGKWFPCFYIKETFEGESEYLIGETPMFRLPYEKRVKELLPTIHKEDKEEKEDKEDKEEKEDIAIKVFGSTNMATKICFEDAFAIGTVEYSQVTRIKMLSDPKPTAFAHYAEEGRSYDENAKIRGNKMYWHNKDTEYKLDNSKFDENKVQQYSPKIEPIHKAKFAGRARFDNLSNEELGALLFIFNLPDTMALKLGMGKPYGMGSIKISNCSLKIIDRPNRYTSILDSLGNWNTSENISTNTDTYINSFINLISQYDNQITSIDNFFKSNRMQQLAALLTFDHKQDDWLSTTSYMELKDFKKDSILQYPINYVKNE